MRKTFALAVVATAVVTAYSAPTDPAEAVPPSALSALPIEPRMPLVGYTRAQFGPAWTDDNDEKFGHDGCDTRDDILARDLTQVVRSNCEVVSGVLTDPYTGKVIDFTRRDAIEVQIDHVVPLADAWMTGAQALTKQERIDFANDPLNLLAVDGPTNERKGDKDASRWLPPAVSFRCRYVGLQIEVKAKYHLWVTQAEHDAMAQVLADDC